MPTRVRQRRLWLPRSQGKFWRAPVACVALTALTLWYSAHLALWAQSPPPRLLINEVQPAPNAVEDSLGEWFELFNPGSEAVNLQFWSIANQSSAEHIFPAELWIPPGGYLLLASHGDPAQNGGLSPGYVYTAFSLASESEQLTLRDPEGNVVDSVAWGEGTALAVTSGASLERATPDANAAWITGHALWPGSAGDLGSPGAPYIPPATATPVPPPTPTHTPPPDTPPQLFLSEIMANPAAVGDESGEWIELYNGDSVPVNLNGWILADQGSDHALLTGDVWLQPGSYTVLARNSDPAHNGGVLPSLSYSGLQLANEADELLLISPWGAIVDQLIWDGITTAVSQGASLERTGFDATAIWATSRIPWPGSAGDAGSPGAAYVPPPTATPTATWTPLPTATATLTPPPAVAPRLFLSEIMANPAAVGDNVGEWIELYNADSVPINLDGWVLADLGSDRATLAGDLWLQPGAYAVVARSSDAGQNGGVTSLASYTGLQLANEADELFLITPWGVTVDQLIWDGNALQVVAGASLERTAFDATAAWTTAHAPWSGSAGDWGSPGAPFVAPAATVPPITPTATPTQAITLPQAWGRRAVASPLQIAQVYPHGSDQEFIVLHNVSGAPLALAGWRLGDAETPGSREGLVLLPAAVTLAPGASWVVARHAATFQALWGRAPDAEWRQSDNSLPLLVRDTQLAAGEIALADDGDEVVLLDPDGAIADAAAWGDGTYATVGLAGHFDLPDQPALVQAPNAPYSEVRDVRHRFMRLPANPFTSFTSPAPTVHDPLLLDNGLVARWGSLGAASTFSSHGTLPPHVLQMAASALGLDFLAIADRDRAPLDMVMQAQSNGPTLIPAWRWQHSDGHQAIIYSAHAAVLLGWGEFLEFLSQENALAQLPPAAARPNQRTPLLAADQVAAPGSLASLQSVWQSLDAPLLPAGNTTPALPGSSAATPHYTGLAATGGEAASILEALAARRGWLTSSPGLWLTLAANTTGSENPVWMGSTVTPGNELVLSIHYGDRSGAGAGLALWQDDKLVRQLDVPPADGRWQLTLPAVPGTMLYAVATQLDGDFAITAPIYVVPAAGGSVALNEALPAPGADHNGDGQTNSGDEYIELINMGSAPLSLAGYSIGDATTLTGGRRFTFGADRVIAAGERLLLWRDDTDLSLNDDADLLQLYDAEGALVDSIAWEQRRAGPSLSRIPDGGDWHSSTPPTPGEPNKPFPPPEPSVPPEPEPPPVDPTDVGDPHSPNFGQATGPAGSVALTKLRGLQTTVEFRAQVVVPPGLYPSAIYVADAALDASGAPLPIAGMGIQIFLNAGDFMPMQEGEWILVRGGVVKSFRGEMEIQISEPGQAWPYEAGTPLAPLPIALSDIGESLEGRLVTFTGVVTGWQGDSIYLGDSANAAAPSIRITVRSSLGWRRPYVQKGEHYQVTGVISQFGTARPYNDGYRVLVRYQQDLVKVTTP